MSAADEVLTLEEAARRLKFDIRTVRDMCKKGELKASKVRTQWRITEEAIRELLNETERRTTA